MKTKSGHISIAEICEQLDNKSLVINRVYQRAAGLWPQSAQRYFIDTILKDFPFQSVYFNEYVLPKTRRVRKDIVDGQQRLTTIQSFVQDEFRLGKESGDLKGLLFSELEDSLQERFLAYSVPIITISLSNENEILEMFRRMNAFMVPLNPAEKRHSQYHGEFKWFINRLADEFSPMFNTYGILTEKQIVRMADAELLTDLSDIVSRGVKNRQPAMFNKLYKDNDVEFKNEELFDIRITETLKYIRENLGEISKTNMSKSYAFYSLVAGLMHNRFGIINDNAEHKIDFEPIGTFTTDRDAAVKNLLILAEAHEVKEEDGDYAEYVKACLSTTHRIAQRTARTEWVIRALRDQM